VAPSLDDEVSLVRDARAALRGGDAGQALALLDEHDRRFPGGALTEDCAAARVYALCALGRTDAARALASRFLSEHPVSPHAASVRNSCGAAVGAN
jgi:outer membrane protein assembly factor BamD (BamD/ComL family)